ncbi:uncharacterized protein LOC132268494 [Cornus florida]|uniref:uncharacterized protein LOC132268494 n=1 Tax=Cornus florida TaxID=4283 RepID=UPI0028A16609|nr:uncharacterized protein LOC132268494 [Cornus florida]
MPMDSDKDVLEMFKVNARKRLIDLYIDKVITNVNPKFSSIETMDFDDKNFDDSDFDDSNLDDNETNVNNNDASNIRDNETNVNDSDDINLNDNDTNVNGNNGGQPEDKYDLENDNNIFGFSSENEEWKNSGNGKNPVHNDDGNRNVEENDNHSEDGTSDYESGYDASTEIDNDLYMDKKDVE